MCEGRWQVEERLVRKKRILKVKKTGQPNDGQSSEACELQGFSNGTMNRHHLNPSYHYDYKAVYLF